MKNIKELAYRIALDSLYAAKITPELEENFKNILDEVNRKRITTTDAFYTQLDTMGIDKQVLRDLVANIITKGKPDEIVKMIFLLGEGKPVGDKSSGKGLKVLSEDWVKRQLDDSELMRRVKPKFWPLFRDSAWIEKEQKI